MSGLVSLPQLRTRASSSSLPYVVSVCSRNVEVIALVVVAGLASTPCCGKPQVGTSRPSVSMALRDGIGPISAVAEALRALTDRARWPRQSSGGSLSLGRAAGPGHR